MGKYQKGILGSFQGKVGTVVGSTWKGIEYMKSRTRKKTAPPTKSQLEQHAKFAFLARFINPLGKLLMLTFKDSAIRMTGTNSAFRYNFENAVTGSYPNYALDYSKVLVSKGQLHNAVAPAAAAAGGNVVRFSWTDNSGIAMANSGDKSILVVYCPELSRFVYATNGAARSTGADSINAGIFTGKTVETWLAFISEDETEVASSLYTGQVVVS